MNEFKYELIDYEYDVTPESAEQLESEIREGEFEWIEILVPSHLYIPIQQIIETFLDSHGVNDGNGGWNKLKVKNESNG